MTDAPLIHNYMGRSYRFDHFKVGADLDIATWDSYPIGFFRTVCRRPTKTRRGYLRQGDPDNQAFHHDLYRAVGRGPLVGDGTAAGTGELGPVEPRALARHGAALGVGGLCARGRSGLLFPLAAGAVRAGADACRTVAPRQRRCARSGRSSDGGAMRSTHCPRWPIPTRPVALSFDYASHWVFDAQPQGADFDYFGLVFSAYRALRRAGLSVDILPPEGADPEGYAFVLIPGMATLTSAQLARLAGADTIVLMGPRTNAKTAEMSIPVPLPPNLPGLDVTVTRVESLPPFAQIPVQGGGTVRHWFEATEGTAPVAHSTEDGRAVVLGDDGMRYLAAWPDDVLWDRIVAGLCDETGLARETLPEGVRLRRTASHLFAFNYASEPRRFRETEIPAAGVMWWAL